jgi:hypothetical protein
MSGSAASLTRTIAAAGSDTRPRRTRCGLWRSWWSIGAGCLVVQATGGGKSAVYWAGHGYPARAGYGAEVTVTG